MTKDILPETGFSEALVRANALHERGFKEWAFYPGMLFGSEDVWWDGGDKRNRPHEGVDWCFYRDSGGIMHHLPHTPPLIPVVFGGTVVRMVKDYIGTSLFVRHEIHNHEGRQLHTIYGHTDPYGEITGGSEVEEGGLIATIADAAKKKAKMSSHLHLSLAWISPDCPPEHLNWDILSDPETALLLDPLSAIACPYTVLEYPRVVKR